MCISTVVSLNRDDLKPLQGFFFFYSLLLLAQMVFTNSGIRLPVPRDPVFSNTIGRNKYVIESSHSPGFEVVRISPSLSLYN